MFHNLYKKQTVFAKQVIDNRINGQTVKFDDTIKFEIPRKGDLISTIFVRMIVRKSPETYIVPIQTFGYEVFEYMELLIGDKIIDHMTGLEMRLLMKMTSTKNNVNALGVMSGEFIFDGEDVGSTTLNQTNISDHDQYDMEYRYFYVPIPFYFFRNPSLAIPLCALTLQEVSIRFKLKPKLACVSQVVSTRQTIGDTITSGNYDDPLFSIVDFSVPVEYVYVSPEECGYFQRTPLNYMITQTQRTTMNSSKLVEQLNFINPLKEIIMYPTLTRCLSLSETDPIYKNRYILFNKLRSTDGLFKNLSKYKGIIQSAELTCDNKTYVTHSIANLKFLKNFQNVIARGRFTFDQQTMTTHEDILSINFALEPSNYMDTGYLNFNAFKSSKLELVLESTETDYTIFVIARSLNIIVIDKGVCNVVFKNSIM